MDANRLGRYGELVEIKADMMVLAERMGRIKSVLKGWRGRGQQARLVLGEGLGHGAGIVAGPGALMGGSVPREEGLTIAFVYAW